MEALQLIVILLYSALILAWHYFVVRRPDLWWKRLERQARDRLSERARYIVSYHFLRVFLMMIVVVVGMILTPGMSVFYTIII